MAKSDNEQELRDDGLIMPRLEPWTVLWRLRGDVASLETEELDVLLVVELRGPEKEELLHDDGLIMPRFESWTDLWRLRDCVASLDELDVLLTDDLRETSL